MTTPSDEPKLTTMHRAILDLMRNGWRLSRNRIAGDCLLETHDAVTAMTAPRCEINAMERAGLIAVKEVAKPMEVMGLTLAGRELLKGHDDATTN
jgi:hypothetical protein